MEQVGFVGFHVVDDLGVARPRTFKVIVTEVADGLGPCAGSLLGGGAAGGAVVLDEQIVEVPGEGGVDGVVAASI